MATYRFEPEYELSPSPADTAPLAHETDHAQAAYDRFIEIFKERPRAEAFLKALVDLLQDAEDLCWKLLQERYLDTINEKGPAEGAQLDGIGKIVGEPRNERTDDYYRAFLRARVLINNSDGKTEDLIDILDVIGHDGIFVREYPPAHVRYTATGSLFPTEANRALKQAKAGGMGFTFVYSTSSIDSTFQASSTYGTVETSEMVGAGSVYSVSTGGDSAGVMT